MTAPAKTIEMLTTWPSAGFLQPRTSKPLPPTPQYCMASENMQRSSALSTPPSDRHSPFMPVAKDHRRPDAATQTRKRASSKIVKSNIAQGGEHSSPSRIQRRRGATFGSYRPTLDMDVGYPRGSGLMLPTLPPPSANGMLGQTLRKRPSTWHNTASSNGSRANDRGSDSRPELRQSGVRAYQRPQTRDYAKELVPSYCFSDIQQASWEAKCQSRKDNASSNLPSSSRTAPSSISTAASLSLPAQDLMFDPLVFDPALDLNTSELGLLPSEVNRQMSCGNTISTTADMPQWTPAHSQYFETLPPRSLTLNSLEAKPRLGFDDQAKHINHNEDDGEELVGIGLYDDRGSGPTKNRNEPQMLTLQESWPPIPSTTSVSDEQLASQYTDMTTNSFNLPASPPYRPKGSYSSHSSHPFDRAFFHNDMTSMQASLPPPPVRIPSSFDDLPREFNHANFQHLPDPHQIRQCYVPRFSGFPFDQGTVGMFSENVCCQ